MDEAHGESKGSISIPPVTDLPDPRFADLTE